MSELTIKVLATGPYLVTGLVPGACSLVDAQGKAIAIPEGKSIALCRCGASTTKPFCDGTHTKIGFMAAEKAVSQADAKK
ncbi:MAG: hypothetical protein NVS3B20_03670 [Polyangiales bacterium]